MPKTTKLPSVIGTIGEAMDLVSKHIDMMLLPVLLDLFLLFGPRFRIYNLLHEIVQTLFARTKFPANIQEEAKQLPIIIDSFLENSNLFGALHTFPIGVPSLLSGYTPLMSPIGEGKVIESDSFLATALFLILFSLIGLVSGVLFHRMIVRYIPTENREKNEMPFGRQLVNIIIFCAFLFALAILLLIPGSCGLMMFVTSAPFLYEVIAVVYMAVILWLAVPFFFTPHAVFLKGKDFPQAVKYSLGIIRWNMPSVTFFIIISVVLSLGMDLIWGLAEASNWLILFSIFGHAFVSVSIITASFLLMLKYEAWQEENKAFIEWRKSLPRFPRVRIVEEREENDRNEPEL